MGKIAVKKCCKKVALGKPKTASSNCCGKKRFKKVRKDTLFYFVGTSTDPSTLCLTPSKSLNICFDHRNLR